MAPPKTMAVSQQQQQSAQTTGRSSQGDQTSKYRKRKAKQQPTNNPTQALQTVSNSDKQQVTAFSDKNSAEIKPRPQEVSPQSEPKDIGAQKLTLHAKEKPDTEQLAYIASPVKQMPVGLSKTGAPLKKDSESTAVAAPLLAKQISTDETEEVDAGIELDGSSNSGSSVKDMNDDQVKSTSVSPVMAQSNVVNENRNSTRHATVNSAIEQVAGSMCTDITPPAKKIISKQQLAANLQVIDDDEEQLQQKLQSKQRRPSLQTSNNFANNSGAAQTPPQSPALCKICDQHVYQMERMMAEKSVYHKGCFRCHQCKTQLRIDNYSSHSGQLYCKAHHRQLFQPQVKLGNEDDVDIVAKSTSKVVDDYLLQRGRLSNLSFSFLQPKTEEIRKRQLIICENEPAELPKDVVRSNTKVDDGIDRLNLNLNNILEKFEKGTTSNGEDSQPSSAAANYEKPSFNIKKTLMAFETNSLNQNGDAERSSTNIEKVERPVRKLSNLNGFLNKQSSTESESGAPTKPTPVMRSESLMLRLKKYESRIAGEQVPDDDADEDENNNNEEETNSTRLVPKKLPSIDLSSLKNQWETGDISNKRPTSGEGELTRVEGGGDNCNGHSTQVEKDEELVRIRQQLARKRSGGSSSIRNIYENAIKEAQQTQAPKTLSSDLSTLKKYSTSEIQQQLLQNGSGDTNKSIEPPTPDKDHIQLNLSKKANKLRERFEQGLINNSSYDDSDEEVDENDRAMSKLEQIRQEKLDDLSVFTEGEIKAREARNMFQQIDRRLSASKGQKQHSSGSRPLSSVSVSMQAKLQAQMNDSSSERAPQTNDKASSNNHFSRSKQTDALQKPIRLINNVRT